MSSEKFRSKFVRGQRSASGHSRKSTKFLPNLTQLNKAVQDLPDPEHWPEETCKCTIDADGKLHKIEFTIKTIARGTKNTPRWVYEGKILIRNRDSDVL